MRQVTVSGTDLRGISGRIRFRSTIRAGRGASQVTGSSAVLLPYRPASVGTARWRLTAELRHAGVFSGAVGDAALVVSELMSNAIRHARPLRGALVEVTWALNGGSVEITVSDGGGATRPRAATPSLSSLGGRGLAIVEHLSCRWGVSADDSRTTVWAVLPAPRRGPGDGVREQPVMTGHTQP
jgi:anti-sigma regulatory factor (Ser/Thr protein kinase)